MIHATLPSASAARRAPALAGVVALALAGLVPCAHARGTEAHAAGLGAGTDQAQRALAVHVLHTLDGRTLTLGSLRGQVVVVNFWATWCSPCRRELPRLAVLDAEIGHRGGRVLAVSIDLQPENVRRFLAAARLQLPVATDGPDGLARELDLQHVPLTLVLDREGRIAFTSSGGDDESITRLETATRSLLSAPVSVVVPGGER